jgi:hypothetical protein
MKTEQILSFSEVAKQRQAFRLKGSTERLRTCRAETDFPPVEVIVTVRSRQVSGSTTWPGNFGDFLDQNSKSLVTVPLLEADAK